MRTIKLTFKTYFSFTVLVASSCDSKTTTTLPTIIPQNEQKNNDQSGSIHIEGPNAMVFCGDKNMIYKGPAREEDETDKPSPSGDRLTLSNKNCINKPLNINIKSTEPGALIVVGSGNVIHMIQEQAPEEEPEPANTQGTDGKQGGKSGTNDEDSSTNGSDGQDDPSSATGKKPNEEEGATEKTGGEGTSSTG